MSSQALYSIDYNLFLFFFFWKFLSSYLSTHFFELVADTQCVTTSESFVLQHHFLFLNFESNKLIQSITFKDSCVFSKIQFFITKKAKSTILIVFPTVISSIAQLLVVHIEATSTLVLDTHVQATTSKQKSF